MAKKARKHRVLAKARRDAAPKNKQWSGEGMDPINLHSDNAEAGPSDHEDASKEDHTEAESGRVKAKKRRGSAGNLQEDARRPRLESDERTKTVELVDEGEQAERDRLERKRLKREKRETRDRSARKVKRQKRDEGEEKEPSGDQYPEEGGPDEKSEVYHEPTLEEDSRRSEYDDLTHPAADLPTPLLEAFPLPSVPTPADPTLLIKQGLPKGLEHAQLVDPSLSAPLDTLPDEIQARLRASGIERLFAGGYDVDMVFG